MLLLGLGIIGAWYLISLLLIIIIGFTKIKPPKNTVLFNVCRFILGPMYLVDAIIEGFDSLNGRGDMSEEEIEEIGALLEQMMGGNAEMEDLLGKRKKEDEDEEDLEI